MQHQNLTYNVRKSEFRELSWNITLHKSVHKHNTNIYIVRSLHNTLYKGLWYYIFVKTNSCVTVLEQTLDCLPKNDWLSLVSGNLRMQTSQRHS